MAEPWEFAVDMNGDGLFTISDFWAWVSQVFWLPGDSVVWLFIHRWTDIGTFLEFSPDDYGGFLSLVISVWAWLIVIGLPIVIWDGKRHLGR